MHKQKYILLVPTRYNDGSQVPPAVMSDIQTRLWILAGGFTVAGTVNGAFKMADGNMQRDELIEYWIGISADQEVELRRMVSEIRELLGQECMYLETSGWIDFV